MTSIDAFSLSDREGGRNSFGIEWEQKIAYPVGVILEQHPNIQRLSPVEKLTLVTELWDDLAAHPADIPVTPEVIAELDRRMEEYRKNPTQVTTWEAIKQRIFQGGA